ncbi:hypothetical protein BV22DRAFT_423149 [Leucogyrophana mollusca]|uniref:Uncharacterized protein n=1 Tax=Leucogyrophana mollusca TaxID=85980 RepID=A0ACB8BIP0_9AGAM|nr:hypothetical protein BV22DRAFT_423149 [Leucogyrophana mollusca]
MHHTLWVVFIAFLSMTALSSANDSAGDCKFAGESDLISWDHAWDFVIYSGPFCGGEKLRYHGGSTLDVRCNCLSFPSESDVYRHWKKMRIHSFVFTARGGRSGYKATIHDDLNCGGNTIGSSVGNWKDASTKVGHKIRSVHVCPNFY